MEKKNVAATLPKKKTTISKGKVKKTIKNTLCRPDPVFWPNLTEDQAKDLKGALDVHKVEIPEFIKPHWKILKEIPKDLRPKQPKVIKVEGLIFGIRECSDALKSKDCSAVIIESTINPRMLIQPLIETCISNKVPVLCLNGLRKISSTNFGIPTSCLGIKIGFLQELKCTVEEIAKLHILPKYANKEKGSEKDQVEHTGDEMEVDQTTKHEDSITSTSFTYLYRSSKKTRVFNPSSEEPNAKKAFIGQDFIKFINKPVQKKSDNKAYMNMILKRMTNNQNRAKSK